jgi:hypothetical protein
MTFNEALAHWESHSDPMKMLDLLYVVGAPDAYNIDIEESKQKGCDCGKIELQWNSLCPCDDRESGDCIMLMLGLLRKRYGEIQIAHTNG